MKYIIANWKANKTYSEAHSWIETFTDLLQKNTTVRGGLEQEKLKLIVCPPSPFLPLLHSELADVPNIAIGAQNISEVEKGAFTGEVTALSLTGLASFAIIGHSERRSHYGETNEHMNQKVAQCMSHSIQPILCIRGTQDAIIPGVSIIAYEPVEAIGTGNNMPVEQVVQMKQGLSLPNPCTFIYGGSVNPETVHHYLASPEIDGFLIGSASLDPAAFLAIAEQTIR